MTWKHVLFATVSGSLFLTLTACDRVSDDSQSSFYVESIGRHGVPGFTPTGWGWKPLSKVSIDIFDEPNGPDSASSEWKHILDETVDSNSLFGFPPPEPPFYAVKRSICGNPIPNQTMVFMAKNLTTGRIQMVRVPVDQYFTFQPCR